MQEKVQDIEDATNKIKTIKKVLKCFIGLFSVSGILLVVFTVFVIGVVVAKKNSSTSKDYTSFNYEVERFRTAVTNEVKNQGLGEDYINVILAIIQCETGGEGTDVNSSDKESNTAYGKNRGDIANSTYSIKCGVAEFKKLLELCSVTDIFDDVHMNIAFEAYETDRDYISYANSNGGYGSENAADYIASKDELIGRNPSFAISMSMYVSLLNNGMKQFIYPLSIHKVVEQYAEEHKSIVYSGVARQVVLSSCEGTVTNVTEYEDYSNIEVEHDNFILYYSYLQEITVEKGDTVSQGTVLGRVAYIDEFYGIEFSMKQNSEYVNPNDYLNVLSITKLPLDEESIKEGEAIGTYALGTKDNIKYSPGKATAFEADELGFIKIVYSTFNDYYENEFKLPTTSYDDLMNCSQVTYKNETPSELKAPIMYTGDVLLYKNESGDFYRAGVYIGNSKICMMTESGVVEDFYNFTTPVVLLRFLGEISDGFTWPLPGFGRLCITSDFAPDRENPVTGKIEAHHGTDIGAPTGTSVIAAADGTVTEAGYNDSMGYHVIISHSDCTTYYMHASELRVSTGDEVKAGTEIMLVGSTGQSTGPHLHFGILKDGSYVNPMDYKYKSEP